MKIKKGSICVIAVLFVASLLAGCNKKEEEAKPVPTVEQCVDMSNIKENLENDKKGCL